MRLFSLFAASWLWLTPAIAETPAFPDDVDVIETHQPFAAYADKLIAAIAQNKMGLVAQACATCGAKSIGVTIPGNRVLMIFNPHYAVRMLETSIPAGIEAPLRLYLTEQADGTALLSYKKPSIVFAPYNHPDLDKMALELDQVFRKIILDAGTP